MMADDGSQEVWIESNKTGSVLYNLLCEGFDFVTVPGIALCSDEDATMLMYASFL
jgi:hypothetical protein